MSQNNCEKRSDTNYGSEHTNCERLTSTNLERCDSLMCSFDSSREEIKKPSILLHSCCGPCSTSVVDRLLDEYDVTVYFYNPNITDADEYARRLEAQMIFIEKFNERTDVDGKIAFVAADYDPEHFFEFIKGLEDEPEGGLRCTECFRLRLIDTVEFALMNNYDYFTTTLSVSPHKNHEIISRLGSELALQHGISFLNRDFKKADGFARSIRLSKKYDLYRQNYCGCEFSKRKDL